MSRIVTLLLALCLTLAPAAARPGPDNVQELNQKAIAALAAKKYDEGIALFQRILEIAPHNSGTAYNLACGYSLKNDLDQAYDWLDKASAWGWGSGESQLVGTTQPMSQIEMIRTDPDLENLRRDPRYEAFMRRLEEKGKKSTAYAASAAVYIPEKIAQLEEMPLLVVLHDNGSTKDQVIAGRWKAVADEIGTALVAPSGKILLGDDPAQGMAWWDDLQAFQNKSWSFEKSIGEAVTAFKKEHKLAQSRVFIAGEGLGSIVAFDVAFGSPGLYKGALGLNGGLLPELLSPRASSAAKAGLKVELWMETSAAQKILPPGQALDKLTAHWNQLLETWGVQGRVQSFTLAAQDPHQIDHLLVEGLKRMSVAPAAIEAGAAK
jgi:predicted esterase